MNNAIKAVSVLTLVSSLTAISSMSMAQDSVDRSPPPSSVVAVSDLDINSSEGAAILYVRIKSAARQICRDQYLRIGMARDYYRCVATAIDDTVAAVNLQQLTSVHRGATAQLASR